MALKVEISEDRTQMTVDTGGEPVTWTAAEVEDAIRMLAEHRARMDPLPPREPGPLQQEYLLQDMWVYGNPMQQRIGLHILTREMGWTLYALPTALVDRVINNIRTGANATVTSLAPPPEGVTKQ